MSIQGIVLMKKLLAGISALFLSISLINSGYSQDYGEPNYQNQQYQPNLVDQSKNDFMIVLAAGGAGAVLGLSTLSFVSEPDDHYDNILTGGAIGIIAGVLYVAYRQANTPPAFQGPQHQVQPVDGRTYSFRYKDIPNSHIAKGLGSQGLQFFNYTTNF